MRVDDILGTENVRFVEPEFAAQTDSIFNTALASAGGDEGRILVDGDGEPIAIAFKSPDGWVAGSFLYRNPTAGLIEQFENMNGEILQEDRPVFTAAVREYYSTILAREVPPAVEDLNPVRHEILSALIMEHWGRGYHGKCIDCCCGSGVGSQVLRSLGYVPTSYDNDASLLSRGLAAGRLLPQETMCLDAQLAARYIEPAPRGIGIMMGEINSFSQEMWEMIVRQLFVVTQKTLITVGTRPEAELIEAWGGEMGRKVTIIENPKDPIYDLWVCSAVPV
jgi:hypothetical protein